jgi:hypothetical protein
MELQTTVPDLVLRSLGETDIDLYAALVISQHRHDDARRHLSEQEWCMVQPE